MTSKNEYLNAKELMFYWIIMISKLIEQVTEEINEDYNIIGNSSLLMRDYF